MKQFKDELLQQLDQDQVIDNQLLCYAYSTDASLYRLIPKLVVFVKNLTDVIHVIKVANTYNQAITFRASGTSLSGQAVTNEALVILSPDSWQNYSIINDGSQIRLESGIIGAKANHYLAPYNRKIGPDPASIDSCKIGGIAANNSSGMCCGTEHNTYQTIAHIKIVLANGSILDTNDPQSISQFIIQNQSLYNGIKELHEQINQDTLLVDLIKHKFKIKNTTGYSINAFIDYIDPIDIIARLIIGSEGTLGFINDITYNTVVNHTLKAVSFICVNSLQEVLDLTHKLTKCNIDAMELFDITSLKAIENINIAKKYLPTSIHHDTSAILIEISAQTQEELNKQIHHIQNIIKEQPLISHIEFTQDKIIYAELWQLRKGILTAIGANRPNNTTMVIEDIAVAIDKLAEISHDLRTLFSKYHYNNAAIFGHVLAGNIHFIFTPKFDNPNDINNYKNFMDEMCRLVTHKYSGSLKAEHGVGRNIAPYVELEWGKQAYNIMWQIKKLFDPKNILNPDVKLSMKPFIHLDNLKQLASIEEPFNKCIECGFCESVCPSLKLNLSPRQRISAYRYTSGNPNISNQLANDYKKYAIDSCATTGLCQTKCPVGINTGELILNLREQKYAQIRKLKSLNTYLQLQKLGLRVIKLAQKLLGQKNSYTLSQKAHRIIPIIPVILPTMPKAQISKFKTALNATNTNKIIYIPSCNNRIMGDENNYQSFNSIELLLNKLEITPVYPENLTSLCCGQLDLSKGNKTASTQLNTQLTELINSSSLPVLIDNSSCFKQLTNTANTIDVIDLVYTNLDKIKINKRYQSIALHIDCSTRLLNKQDKIMTILNKLSDNIVIPNDINCCGFAGDKGLFYPELNKKALEPLKAQINHVDVGVTFNRNCQIGLSFHGNKTYLSLSELILNMDNL